MKSEAKNLTLNVTKEWKDRLAIAAKADNRSATQLIIVAVNRYIDEMNEPRTMSKSQMKRIALQKGEKI